jgi:hypothetical protein
MPQKVWAVGEEVLAADFNTYVQQQVVPTFSSLSELQAQYAGAPLGALAVTLDTFTTYLHAATGGTGWRDARPTHFARVRRNAAFNTINGSTQVMWDTVETDVEGNYSIATGFYTCPEAGIYEADCQVSVNLTGAASVSSILSHNAGTWTSQNWVAPAAQACIVRARGSRLCAAGDKISGNVNCTVAGQAWRNPASDQSFQVQMVGRS